MFDARTPEERRAYGHSRRKQLPRQEHNAWSPSDRRTDPVDAIASSAVGRVPALLPIKWERMAASPFGFFRGAVPVMAADLAVLPHTGINVQICGDAHVRNLGAYAAPDGRLLFDINDFDETISGPFEWDLKRMATSLILTGRETGAKNSACSSAAEVFLACYRKSMRTFARMPLLEIARYQVHRLQRITPVSQALRKAERETPQSTLERLTIPNKAAKGKSPGTTVVPPPRIFIDSKPLQYRLTSAPARRILDSLSLYSQTLLPDRRHFLLHYRPLDVAFRVVGTGSVGLRDFVIYFEGNGPGDPLFLQIKEEPGSAYSPYLGDHGLVQHHGERVAEGQRAMQVQSDPFLGWTTIQNRHYLVRQLADHKGTIDIDDLKGDGLTQYAEICGELLARGHARSGDPVVLDGYIGASEKFDLAVAAFAREYADQTERDYHTFLRSRFAPHRKKTAASTTPPKKRAKPKTRPGKS
ncbi:MAG TPA: DUF2252 domain-containing protein [Acidobacteriaceae bacterium]|nr:DUF2252 domain-containing protein [Acidobacteriaceae bacterium]